jgi:CCR4-NOT transcription complex subunit 9
METGSELSKTVATFIIQKILYDDIGLTYICATPARFYAVSSVLSNMVQQLVSQPSQRLLKHVIRCYLRLTDNPRARDALKTCLPEAFKLDSFVAFLKDDLTTSRWLQQLLDTVMNNNTANNLALNTGPGLNSNFGLKQDIRGK